MVKRNLDGVFFRVKRGDKFENVCFSDMTREERDELVWKTNNSGEYWKRMAYIMADTIRKIGDELDLFGE